MEVAAAGVHREVAGRRIVELVAGTEVEIGLVVGVDAYGAVGAHEINIVGLGVGGGIADGDTSAERGDGSRWFLVVL